MIQGFSGIFGFLWLAPLYSAPGLVSLLQQSFFCDYKVPAAASASRLKPKLSLTAQTKILELSVLSFNWPNLGHMPTIEPITGVQQPHALPMLGGRTWEHSWSENDKWAVYRRGKNGCCGEDAAVGLGRWVDWETQREK